MKLLIIGHSHTTSLANAALSLGIEHQIVRLGRKIELNLLRQDIASSTAALIGAAVPIERLSDIIAEAGIFAVVSVGGNFHNVVGLIKHSRPYDFYVPDLSEFPIAVGHHIIQYDVMLDFFYANLRQMFLAILDIKRILGKRMVHVDSPPPLADNDLIAENIDEYFRELFPNFLPEINAPAIRLKHWHVAQTLYKKFCGEAGILFLENNTPRFQKYYLHSRYIGHDATHASAEFSEDYIRSVSDKKDLFA